MPRFKVAHIREQGVDLIIIPLESPFGSKTLAEQKEALAGFQLHATGAGLAGKVVLVWDDGGRMGFLADRHFHRYFESITLAFIFANLNRELYW